MNQKKTILVVEDDAAVRRTIVRALERLPYNTLEVATCTDALARIEVSNIDLAVIDLGLPDADGLDLVRKLQAYPSIGVLILSGRHEPIDKVIGIEVGADDYLAKPFDSRELAARIKNILRRMQPLPVAEAASNNVYTFGGWKLFEHSHVLHDPTGRPVTITSGEFALLLLFLKNPGRTLSRNQIMNGLYGDQSPAFDRSVDVRVGRLRRKICLTKGEDTKIHTVRNVGYLFSTQVNGL